VVALVVTVEVRQLFLPTQDLFYHLQCMCISQNVNVLLNNMMFALKIWGTDEKKGRMPLPPLIAATYRGVVKNPLDHLPDHLPKV
jgi:hypothetical protein